jgi:hypothetical protein
VLLVASLESKAAPATASEVYRGNFVAEGETIRVWRGDSYQPLFLKGICLGLGVPGKEPGDLAITQDQYHRWFGQMSQAGFNVVRIYTMQPPYFYQELRDYNLANPDHPLYLLDGAWLDDLQPSDTLDLYPKTASFEQAIEETIDVLHGAAQIAPRPSKASGTFDADVSPWVLGLLLGREVDFTEVRATNNAHPANTSFTGSALLLPSGNPSEVWVAQRLEHAIVYERAQYGAQRPVGFSNWQTLDPIHHPTESRNTGMDIVSVDLANLQLLDAPAGVFVSYHLHPYWPLFVSEDPGYRTYSDELGPNSYLGYIVDIKKHYKNWPVIAAEYGVPDSWGIAKFSYSGMHHGGHTEVQQGIFAARMLRNIYNSGYTGAFYFHWMDGWFKPVWITNYRTFPADRLRLWHDITNPAQNYGLVAFDVGPPTFRDLPIVNGGSAVTKVSAAADAEFLHLEIETALPMAAGDNVVIGLDTYRQDLGESVLPNGVRAPSLRSELALSATRGASEAQLVVMSSYDTYGLDRNTPASYSLLRSTVSDGGAWMPVKWASSLAHGSDDGRYQFPADDDPIGRLRARDAAQPATSHDAVVFDGNIISVRLPWTILNFTDPTALMVLHDDPATTARDAIQSDGVALAISAGGEVTETARFIWTGWDEAPPTTERFKDSMAPLAEQLQALPATPIQASSSVPASGRAALAATTLLLIAIGLRTMSRARSRVSGRTGQR